MRLCRNKRIIYGDKFGQNGELQHILIFRFNTYHYQRLIVWFHTVPEFSGLDETETLTSTALTFSDKPPDLSTEDNDGGTVDDAFELQRQEIPAMEPEENILSGKLNYITYNLPNK